MANNKLNGSTDGYMTNKQAMAFLGVSTDGLIHLKAYCKDFPKSYIGKRHMAYINADELARWKATHDVKHEAKAASRLKESKYKGRENDYLAGPVVDPLIKSFIRCAFSPDWKSYHESNASF